MKRIFLNKKYLLSLGAAAIFTAVTYAPANAFAALSMVQNSAQVSASTCSSPSTITYSYPSNVTSGNLLIVSIGSKASAGENVATPTDTLSNTWTLISQQGISLGGNNTRTLAVYYAVANSSGADSVTVACPTTISGWTQGVDMDLQEVSGSVDLTGNPVIPAWQSYDSSTGYTDPFSFSYYSTGDMKISEGFSVNARNTSTPTSSQGGSWAERSARGTIGSYYAVYDGTQSPLSYDWLDTSTGLATTTQWSALTLRVKTL